MQQTLWTRCLVSMHFGNCLKFLYEQPLLKLTPSCLIYGFISYQILQYTVTLMSIFMTTCISYLLRSIYWNTGTSMTMSVLVESTYGASLWAGAFRARPFLASCPDTILLFVLLLRLIALQWRQNGHDSVSNHQPYDSLLNRLYRRRSKKTSKLRVTGLCAGNSPGTGEFPAQMASNAENVSIWRRHHGHSGCLETLIMV